ncbi:histidine phosphatase family protein [Sphingomonas donggukensis]|uniref:Histidine phosphatase family protein n=1 Tax=Sphingomonas donggukensis TaxID=2949093 RepID=A0ABY4TUY2_9SPHN|nr:phosphoglycerate mutase family protein [Sphingomonas donggukensis]URW76199.1 histidine phosphatase family protein [Sphingomonas donggukensis]
MRHVLLLAAAVLTAAPATAQTYVMRHLDTPEGQRDPDLLPNGQASARKLVRWFRGKRLTAIYVSDFRRTRQTAAPLAAARRITPTLYDPARTADLLAAVRAERGPVLIVGHSNTVPDIVEGLGGTRPAPLTHPDFGDVWTVRGTGTKRTRIDR